MSLRYSAGCRLLALTRLLKRLLRPLVHLASLPQKLALIIWTPAEIDRHSREGWDSRNEIEIYAELEEWLDRQERILVEKYLTGQGEVLNLACGAGREALLLGRRGLRVTGCDWSPRMIAAAQSRAQDSNLPVCFEVADLYDLQYPEETFDYALLTNIAYSYFFPRRRRIHLLKQTHSCLKSGGLFIISFARGPSSSAGRRGFVQWLLSKLASRAPFNREYEPGDRLVGTFIHWFEPEALRGEFEEARFSVREWWWEEGYAVLAKS